MSYLYYHLTVVYQICLACEEMHIHCAPCTSSQLAILKRNNIIPSSADQCGLITKSDVERLISYLNSSDLIHKDSKNSSDDTSTIHSSPNVQKREGNSSTSTPSRPPSETSHDNVSTSDVLQGSNANKHSNNDFPKSNEEKFSGPSLRPQDQKSPSYACMEPIPNSPSDRQIKETSYEKDKKVRIMFYSLIDNQIRYFTFYGE